MDSAISLALSDNHGLTDECQKLTNKIRGALFDIAHSFVYIGFLLAECDYYETYKEWGYSSIHEYALDQFGFKKSSTYNFINICKQFSDNEQNAKNLNFPYAMTIKGDYREFNYSQLVEMLSMNEKQRSQVTPDMSVKQIREVKKGSIDEPNIDTLFNLQLYRQIFSRKYHYKIDGKKCVFSISGENVEASDIYPEGYMISFDVTYGTSGHGFGAGRFLDYDEFRKDVLRCFYRYDKSYDSRRLESASEEAPAPDVPDESPAPLPEAIKNDDFDLLEPAIGDLCDLFDEIEEVSLSADGFDSRLSDIAIRIFKEHGYVIYKKSK